MNEEIANNLRAHWTRELKAIPGVRWWKLDEPKWEALTMAGVAQVEEFGRFVPDEFKKLVPQTIDGILNFRQPRPEEPPPISEVWRDKITGTVPANPWGDPEDLESQKAVMQHDPELAKWLKACAKGVSYALLAKQRGQAARAARLAAIRYGPDDEPNNAFYGTDLEAQGALVRADPDRAAVWRWEATTPVEIPWLDAKHDPDGMGHLQRHAPDVFRLAHRAVELMRERAKAEANEAQAQIEAAQKKLAEAKKRAA